MNQNAKWIMSPVNTDKKPICFVRDIRLQKPIQKATLEVTAIGVYVAYLNGMRIGDEILAPGFTDYFARVQVQSYDVTSMLDSVNRLEIGVGPGWAIDFRGKDEYYGKQISLWARLTLTHTDGQKEMIGTDECWEVFTSHITHSEIYHGETVDLTAAPERLGYAIPTRIKGKRIPQAGEKIKEQEHIAAKALLHTPKGETVIDFGQNLTGYVEVKIHGKRGERIVLHHAEVLDADGNFYTENMRAARNECIYVLDGRENVFKPSYSFQGFRYVQLAEFPNAEIDLDSFTAIAVHSEIKRTGDFYCGNEKINQLYHNIIWGQKSNYLDIPTDCPQRDERLGWTGDAQLFCRTAAIHYDVERFFEKWLEDMMIDQWDDGAMPFAVPCVWKDDHASSAAWADAAVVIPWELYMAYGNVRILRRFFPMMKKWVDYMHASGPEEFLWIGHWHFGDWLALDAGEDSYTGKTPKDLIGSAFYAYSTSLLIKAGEALGEDMSAYKELYTKIRTAFGNYFLPGGKLYLRPDTGRAGIPDPPLETQTAYVLILHFGLCEQQDRQRLADRLAAMIEENQGLMTTGVVGTTYLLHTLSENGHLDLAYSLLFEERAPSWLYSVNHGATTIWEHWNGIKEDGSFWSEKMNSFNHYVYGAVYDWIFATSVGITPTAPAYKTVNIAPHPNPKLGFVDAYIDSRNGRLRVHWYYRGNAVYYQMEIPHGVTATLMLPSGKRKILGGGTYLIRE